MFYMRREPCTETQSLNKQRGTEGMLGLNMKDYIEKRIYRYLYMHIPSLFILPSKTFVI